MYDSFEAFMQGLIDYAGLFPPAGLPFEKALDNYINYQDHPSSWILSHFICPVRLLPELENCRAILETDNVQLSLSVLPESAETTRAYLELFERTLQQIFEFSQKMGRFARIYALEFKISPQFMTETSGSALHDFFLKLFDKVYQTGSFPPRLFFELQKSPHWAEQIDDFIEEIWSFNEVLKGRKISSADRAAGIKIRCGGGTAADFPTTEEIARVISACAEKLILFKATAGLHHPMRHLNASTQQWQHGFFNVFGAALMAYRYPLNTDEILMLLAEKDPKQFVFKGELFAYKNWKLHTAEIQEIRSKYVISFGSCSFDEPRDDLIQLGLLKE